jgi:DNA-binding transcriptional regulator YiaG
MNARHLASTVGGRFEGMSRTGGEPPSGNGHRVPKKAPRNLIRTVGRRIAELRSERMTQAEFAECLGTSVQWVSRVELGENLGSPRSRRIADVLEVEVSSLFVDPGRDVHTVKRGRPRKVKGG